MARFLITYYTGEMPQDPESIAQARRAFQFGVAGVHYPDHRQGDIEVHAAMVPGSPPASGRGQPLQAFPSGRG